MWKHSAKHKACKNLFVLYDSHFHYILAFSGGARVDLVDQDGHSLLHWAALGGNADVCQILIENKINPNVQDYAGRTPLQCAAYGGYINCMAVLMENNADPNIQDKEVERLGLFYIVCSKVFRVFFFSLFTEIEEIPHKSAN